MNDLLSLARDLGISDDAVELRGRGIAKIDPEQVTGSEKGRVVLVTAMTPTPAGEGKTTTTIGLVDGLRQREDLLAGLGLDGTVTVEGHFVGQLSGLHFVPAQGESELEDKALRAAAQRAVGPEITRRLGTIAAEPDEAFALMPDGAVLWHGQAAGTLELSRLFAPRVRLFGELGPAPARERATRRLEAFLAAEAGRRLGPLRDLEAAIQSGKIKALAVTTPQRSATLPNVPTMEEAGIKGYQVFSWFGLAAPAGLSAPVQQKLEQALERVAAQSEVKAAMVKAGAEPAWANAQGLAAFMQTDLAQWKRVAAYAKISLD